MIDRVNPFSVAYAVLSKALNEGTLKQVKAAVEARKATFTEEEARELTRRAVQFKRERGRSPDIGAADAWEQRMAQGVAPRNSADEVATRTPCPDFSSFKALFDQVRDDLRTGVREARKFERDASIKQGGFFILGGQLAYVASVPKAFETEHGHPNGRLRVIYDNATQSETLLRSFQRALYKPELDGRRITDPELGPLFGSEPEEGDIDSGTIYVLRSQSNHPFIAAHRDVIHKIGVTGGRVETRIARAASDPTYLMAPVDVVATYKLAGVHRTRLEAVFHRVFAASRLDLAIPDRFGASARPREWFLAPLPVIDEVVTRIRDGSITGLVYDPSTASLSSPL